MQLPPPTPGSSTTRTRRVPSRSPADGADIAGTVSLTSNSADGGSGVATVTFQSSPAGANTWTNQAASWNTTVELDGDHDLRVVTTDNAGNSFTSATITVTVDNTARDSPSTWPTRSARRRQIRRRWTRRPSTREAASPTSASRECTAANDDSCAVDTWTSLGVDTTSPYGVSWAIPADGTRLLRVRATDNAGRQTTKLVLTTVDRTRPTGSVTVPAAGANLRGTSVALMARSPPTLRRGRSTPSPSSARPPAPVRGPTSRPIRRRHTTRHSTRAGWPTASTTCASSRPTRPETRRPRPQRCR